jgi:hypothetical protein
MITEAKNLLTEKYYSEVESLKEKYHSERDEGLSPEFPKMPEFPTFEEIKALADEMNTFVSQR